VSCREQVNELFASDKFQRSAKSVCPKDQQVLDPFQFNFLLQLPGQTVALHLDAPYFWGAHRYQLPQWLLVTMKFSGLFEEEFVSQVQVVGYLHGWEPESKAPPNTTENLAGAGSGEFLYWLDKTDATPVSIPPRPLSGTLVDGSKTLHAAGVYQACT